MISQNQQHIILRQTLDVALHGAESEGLALHQVLPEVMEKYVNPAIEKVLNHYANFSEYISIDYLEIDVGSLSFAKLEQDLAEQVKHCLERALREKMMALAPLNELGQSDSQINESSVAVHETYAQSVRMAFLHFIHTGRLPWSFKLEHGSLEDTVLAVWRDLSVTQLSFWRAEIKASLMHDEARKRLRYQFTDKLLEKLLVLLAPNTHQAILKTLLFIDQLKIESVHKQILKQAFWQAIIQQLAIDDDLNIKQVLQQTLILISEHVLARNVESLTVLKDFFAGHGVNLLPLNPSFFKLNRDANETLEATRQADVADNPIKHARLHTVESEPQDNSVEKRLPLLYDEASELKVGIYTNFAGLVLLHPFLPRFFEVLGITINDKIVASSRAVNLLHYLTTGQKHAAEYELVLAKVLCNIPLAQAVEYGVEFTEAELAQASALLEAVISHWQALKDTSVEGLRGTFLIRNGKLTQRDDGDWLLQVESKSFDILLNSLPWGISMIQLPWMPKMLRVEWM